MGYDTTVTRIASSLTTWHVGLIVIVTAAAYTPALRGGFIWDDDEHVTENQTLRTADGLRRIWFEIGAVAQYYPLVHTTFWIEYQLWGESPLGYHAVNIALHALNAVLVWLVLRRLRLPGAWLAALIFALHPVQVESVAWITERKNVLSGAFYLLALLAYLRFSPLDVEVRPTWRWRSYTLTFVLFLGGLLSKTVTASLPAAILLLIWWKRGRIRPRNVVPLIPLFVVGIGLGLLTVWMEKYDLSGTGRGASGAMWDLTFVERGLTAGRAVWFYAAKLIWPARQAFIYPRWEIDASIWWQYLYPLMAGGLLVALAWWRDKIGRGPLVALLFFGGTLMPALGFLNVYFMQFSFVADHFQYLACLGPIALLAALLTVCLARASGESGPGTFADPFVGNRSMPRLWLPIVSACVLAVLTWQRCKVYRDAETLWRDTLEKNPTAWMAHLNLGRELSGRKALSEAMDHYREALRLRPGYAMAHYNLASALLRTERLDEAVEHFTRAIECNPELIDAYVNLAIALAEQGKLDRAAAALRKGLSVDPARFDMHTLLGDVFVTQGQVDDGIGHYLEALRLNPSYTVAQDRLGKVITAEQDPALAEPLIRRILTRCRDRLGNHHAATRSCMAYLIHLLRQQGRTAEADALQLEFTEIQKWLGRP